MKQFISKNIFAIAIGTHIIARILFSSEISNDKIDLATAFSTDEALAQQTIIDKDEMNETDYNTILTAVLD